MAQKFYAVKEGKVPGVYCSWAECKEQVNGYRGAIYKSFSSKQEAVNFISGASISSRPETNDDMAYHIYVDGSYSQQRYSWGFAVYKNGELIYKKNGLGKDPNAAKLHNVAGEVQGTIEAVLWAQAENIDYIVIHHDYIGISEWAEKRWKTNNEITKRYAEFMQPHLCWVKFNKVAGHTGVAGNELADRLAKQALGLV